MKKHWEKIPSKLLESKLLFVGEQGSKLSVEISALLLYATFHFVDEGNNGVVVVTYDDIQNMTELSRSLISWGIKRLVDLELVIKTKKRSQYKLVGKEESGGWFKLPCKAIFHDGKITPFQLFTLRTKAELFALKIYFYIAMYRNNNELFSMVSYDKLTEKKIPRNAIRTALSLLLVKGLLSSAIKDGDSEVVDDRKTPTKYYLTGCRDLCKPKTIHPYT